MKYKKILLATLVVTSLSTTAAFASPISINEPNTTIPKNQLEANLMSGTYTSGWKSGTITGVNITKNDTRYNDNYLESKVEKDSFAATFTLYSSTDKLFSPYPRSVRTLYGSAAANSSYTDGKTYVTYSYISSAGDYEADVTVSYNIN